jgi:hypothetical protein
MEGHKLRDYNSGEQHGISNPRRPFPEVFRVKGGRKLFDEQKDAAESAQDRA